MNLKKRTFIKCAIRFFLDSFLDKQNNFYSQSYSDKLHVSLA